MNLLESTRSIIHHVLPDQVSHVVRWQGVNVHLMRHKPVVNLRVPCVNEVIMVVPHNLASSVCTQVKDGVTTTVFEVVPLACLEVYVPVVLESTGVLCFYCNFVVLQWELVAEVGYKMKGQSPQ